MTRRESHTDRELRQVVTQQSMRLADEKFRELTEDGVKSLTVFRNAPIR